MDIGFFALFPGAKVESDITYYILNHYELYYITSTSNPLVHKKMVSWNDILGQNFICQSEDSQMYDICRAALIQRNYNWNCVTFFQSINSIIDHVGSGFGGTLLSKPVISLYNTQDIAVLPMEEPIEYALSWQF